MSSVTSMNSKILITLNVLLVAGLVGLYYLHFVGSEKIAFVDSAKLLANYEGMQQARQAYQQKASVWQANIDTLTQEVQSALKEYEKDKAQLSQKEQELSQELLKNKQQQLVNYQRAIQEKAAQEDKQMTQTVITEVNNYLSEFGSQHNYKVILVANETGTIAYAQEGMDVTEEVLAGLNHQQDGK